jgi:hypothetical protein
LKVAANSLGADTRASKMFALQLATTNFFGNLLRCECGANASWSSTFERSSQERRTKILGENAAFCQFL